MNRRVEYEESAFNVNVEAHTTVQSQKAVSAYFTSEQILPFSFAEQYTWTLIGK